MSIFIGITMVSIGAILMIGGTFLIYDKSPDQQVWVAYSAIPQGNDVTIERRGKWLRIGTKVKNPISISNGDYGEDK